MSKFKFDIQSPDDLLGDLIQTTRIESGGQLTKFTKTSVIRAILYAFSRTLSFAKGYISSMEVRHFLSSCYGEDLDNYALENYNEKRKAASASSAEIFLTALPGTLYPVNTEFKSVTGVSFFLKSQVVVPSTGLAFGNVESDQVGEQTKAYVGTITRLVSDISGHIKVTNLQPSIGGFSEESDDQFRARLYTIPFQVSRNVPKTIESVIYTLFNTIARARVSVDASGATFVGLLKDSGADLSEAEISAVKSQLQNYLAVSNVIYWNIVSMPKIPVDITCTVTVAAQADVDSVFKEIQEELLSYLDFRYWEGTSVRSEVLLSKLSEIQAILDVRQDVFSPSVDIEIGDVAVPFLRSIQVNFIQNDVSSVQTLGATRPSIETSPFSPNRANLLTSYIGG